MKNLIKAIVIGGVAGLTLGGCDGDNDTPTAEETVVAPVATDAVAVPVPMATDTTAPDSTMTGGAMDGTATESPTATPASNM